MVVVIVVVGTLPGQEVRVLGLLRQLVFGSRKKLLATVTPATGYVGY